MSPDAPGDPAVAADPAGGEGPVAAPAEPDRPPVPDLSSRTWSAPAQAGLGAVLVLVLVAVVLHLGSVFLFLAPSNQLSQRFQQKINSHIYPEFEQNWQLFAPNPLQDNIHVEAEVQTQTPDGAKTESGWVDLTAQDLAAIKYNPAPSHANQNLIRRAWDYYANWHDSQSEAGTGSGASLSEEYLKRLALQRFGKSWDGRPITAVQVRAAIWSVPAPTWNGPQPSPTPSYRTLGWWAVSPGDFAGLGAHA